MSADELRYWKSQADREAAAAGGNDHRDHRDEFAAVSWPTETSRRSFLKAAGFTFAGAWAAGCSRAPVEQAIPYLVKPEEITPGRAYSYASTCAGCSAGCGLLAKTRDGRPVKLEGNPEHPLSAGALCAAGQASVLGLYDSQRLTGPLARGRAASWAEVDRDVMTQLEQIRRSGGGVRVLTGTLTSPTTRSLIARFLSGFTDGRHVMYDALSSSAIPDAHQLTHGARLLPHYRFGRADVIVGIDADFLGTWLSPVEFARGWAAARRVDAAAPSMAYHVQIEPRMSVTGSKADRRLRVAPGDIGLTLTHLAARIASRAGVPFAADGLAPAPVSADALEDLSARLWSARGRSLVVGGSHDVAAQVLVNFINDLLGNYGATLDIARPSYQRQGSDGDLQSLRDEIANGRVAALIIGGVNPLYDMPDADVLGKSLAKIPLVISLSERIDETSSAAHFVCSDHHPLESWSDAEPIAGLLSLTQPAIRPIGGTRAILETFAAWSGRPQPALEILRAHWQEAVFPRAGVKGSFDEFWDRALERGVAEVSAPPVAVRPFDRSVVHPIVTAASPASGELTLVLYPTVAMSDGRHAHNAWLHELPDPISKVTWDNYACLSPATASSLGVSDGDVVRLDTRDQGHKRSMELPAFVQPGQHDRVVAVALGYGRKGTDRFVHVGPQWLEARATGSADGIVGQNAAPFLRVADGRVQYATSVTLVKTGGRRQLASTQDHHTLMPPEALASAGIGPRPIVQEVTLAALVANQHTHGEAGKAENERHEGEKHEAEEHESPEEKRGRELWPADHPYEGHRWALAIDLSACTGCSACVTACQVENNVPVVGQDEVRRHREMHWIRLDRYYASDGADVDVVHQPMLCQHCENAPCETVCPVLATVHSDEGLNEQVYNRCVGTRYCANNCPYKVRRFNWFNYPHEDRLQNLVLNPDVTVRTRGVMEKCSLCVQRIQEARMEARREGRPIADGEIQTACQQTCPAQAIVFGDVNDPKSRVAQLFAGQRSYRVLEELNVQPSIRYLKVVRNRPETGDAYA